MSNGCLSHIDDLNGLKHMKGSRDKALDTSVPGSITPAGGHKSHGERLVLRTWEGL